MSLIEKIRRVADYCFGFDIAKRPGKAQILAALAGWVFVSLVFLGLYLVDILPFRELVNLSALLAFALSLNAIGLGFVEAKLRNPIWILSFSFFWQANVVPYFPSLALVSN